MNKKDVKFKKYNFSDMTNVIIRNIYSVGIESPWLSTWCTIEDGNQTTQETTVIFHRRLFTGKVAYFTREDSVMFYHLFRDEVQNMHMNSSINEYICRCIISDSNVNQIFI